MRLFLGACLCCLVGCLGSNSSPAPPSGDGGAPLDDGGSDASLDGGGPDSSSPEASVDGSAPEGGGEAGPPTSFGTGHVTSPQGIAIDPSTGVVWVAMFGGGVAKFDASDAYVATYGTLAPGKITQGATVALDSKGNVYVGDYGTHDVVELTSSGAFIATFPSADAGVTLGRVTGVALDANDHLFAIDDDASTVFQFDAAGNVTAQFSTSQSGQAALAGSVGLHFDASGNLWIADYYYHAVAHYSPTGTLLGSYGTSSTTATLGGLSEPYGLTVDVHGNVWVTDAANNDVQSLDTSGTFKSLLGATGTGDGQLQAPAGIAVDANGRVLVADSGNNRIVVFTP